jgi:hypothetical protein
MRSLLLASVLSLALPAAAQSPDETPLLDVLEVMVLDRNLVAIDAETGGQRTLPLRLDERVLWKGARGRVGVVFTDQRLAAVAVESAAWQQSGWHRGETLPERAVLGDRVALVITSDRAVGFNGATGNLLESRLGLNERVLSAHAGANVAVVVTDRRALGLSPLVGGFFSTKVFLEERLESVEAGGNLATVTTDRRVLVFRTPTGTWEERRRTLR